jgi:ABC-type siderophore export system fused ATPase/permease subunit
MRFQVCFGRPLAESLDHMTLARSHAIVAVLSSDADAITHSICRFIAAGQTSMLLVSCRTRYILPSVRPTLRGGRIEGLTHRLGARPGHC